MIRVDDEHLDSIFKALGDPIRRGILDRLAKRPGQSLFEICVAAVTEDGRTPVAANRSRSTPRHAGAGRAHPDSLERSHQDAHPRHCAAAQGRRGLANKHLKKGTST